MSGAKDRRPGLDRLLLDARRAKFKVVVCWALDRIGRDLKHLLAVLEDLQSLNIPFVSLKEGLDLGSASGRLQLAILAALSQFERERLKERTVRPCSAFGSKESASDVHPSRRHCLNRFITLRRTPTSILAVRLLAPSSRRFA
jgi:hypothetical protein